MEIIGGNRETRHALEQDVAVGQHADNQPVDHVLLTDNHLLNFSLESRDECTLFADLLIDEFDTSHSEHSLLRIDKHTDPALKRAFKIHLLIFRSAS